MEYLENLSKLNLSASATMGGAISIVNAIATSRGSTLGISLKVKVKIQLEPGHVGISRNFVNDKLVNKIIRSVLPPSLLKTHFVSIKLSSEIPAGWGLKSSSAVSNAVSLVCHKIVNEKIYDKNVLNTAVNSSLWAKVSITGAFDDACACYYGGLIITNNQFRKLIRRDPVNEDLAVIIYLPTGVARGETRKLRIHRELFNHAFKLTIKGDYWKAMNLNGVLTNSILYNNYSPMIKALESGSLGVSYSGNGPAIAAVVHKDNLDKVRSSLDEKFGKILIAKVNNTKASVD
ncbi:shikimate kinase [Candidatus Nitrosocosmicus agrestis]|uniref:shikimate kinase n=1 Tax=Candidatus Nitrosocosmicus agrestis TaxID=2563600 RepID=UPI0012595582|nr:shikimate kinase [Candidatus Nitrosocosmicus sp. SS]KAA2279272.1 shikimate kinase [Candidatus Nitrosocosmicus sp. SS]KAF0867878.1 shikimate kinase [Candidatus Nitrosocosmicus sp. SS]